KAYETLQFKANETASSAHKINAVRVVQAGLMRVPAELRSSPTLDRRMLEFSGLVIVATGWLRRHGIALSGLYNGALHHPDEVGGSMPNFRLVEMLHEIQAEAACRSHKTSRLPGSIRGRLMLDDPFSDPELVRRLKA
ncbi:hypothetical protein, partial [Paracoccus aerius]